MKWYEKLLNRFAPKTMRWASDPNGYTPIYGQYGTNIYYSDVVQQALKCIVDEVKKLNPTHVRKNGDDPTPIRDSSIQRVLDEPNELMTTSEFIEKVTWLLLLNYNAFILPTYDTWVDDKTGVERRFYTGLYPILPNEVDFLEDETDRLFIRFTFNDGSKVTYPYDDVIHIKYNYSVNQYMGGNNFGQPDNRGLLSTLDLNEKLLKGIAKAMNASYSINGIVKYNTLMDKGKMEKAIKEFENKLNNSESGWLPIDLKAEAIPFERKVNLVDENTLKFIDEKILRNWGVPLAILTGDYTKEQYEAFYQKTLEGIALSMSQAFTKKLFTNREKSFGNRVEFYPKDLIFMTVSQTLEMINILSPTGGMYENEKRVALGLRPLPELEGKRYMSLNWIDANNADKYQVGNETEVNTDEQDGQ